MAQDLPQNLWPHWQTYAQLGQGGFGAVYEIRRDIFGDTDRAALKLIQVPKNNGEIEYLRSEGYDDANIAALFEERMKDIVEEYKLMSQLKGHANVVYCDDFSCVPLADKPGWNIFIKMELLNPMMKLPAAHFTQKEIIRLGIDLCRALELCKDRGIIHRDIKPQNIFQARDGNYKLGDFGIAKSIDRTTIGTVAGTYQYMAPEVYNNRPYGHTADIYSLGLVLYWLLNARRGPFLPLPPSVPRRADMDKAISQRLRGVAVPPPANGSAQLKQLVQKACAYSPEERFATARDMRRALEEVMADLTATQGNVRTSGARTSQAYNKREAARKIVSYAEEYSGIPIGGTYVRHVDAQGKRLGYMDCQGPHNDIAIVSQAGTQWSSPSVAAGARREIAAKYGESRSFLVCLGNKPPQYRLENGANRVDISVQEHNGAMHYRFQQHDALLMEMDDNVSGIPEVKGWELSSPVYVSQTYAPVDADLLSLMLAVPWLCAAPEEQDIYGKTSNGMQTVGDQEPLLRAMRTSQKIVQVPVVRNADPQLAFAACLAMIYPWANGNPMKVQKKIPPIPYALSGPKRMEPILNALNDYGFMLEYLDLSQKEDLDDLMLPMVLIAWNHPERPPFAVLQGFRNGMVYLVDPVSGPFTLTPEAFVEQYWKEAVVDCLFAEELGSGDAVTGKDPALAIFQGCPAEKVYAFYLSRILEYLGQNHSWEEIAQGSRVFTRADFDQAAKGYGLTWETKPASREEVIWGDSIALMGLADVELLFERDDKGTIYLWDPREGRVEVPLEAVTAIGAMQLRTFAHGKKGGNKKQGIWPFR